MSRTIILTFGSLATFTAIALAQSTIEPPRRATPSTDASLLAAPTKGGVVLPGATAPAPAAVAPNPGAPIGADGLPMVAAPAPATPAATDGAGAKPPIATGANAAALEAAKTRMAEAQARARAGIRPSGPGGANPAGGAGNPAGGAGGPKPGVPLSSPVGADPFSPAGAGANPAASAGQQKVEITQNLTATVDDVIADYELNAGVTVLRTGNISGVVPISVNPNNQMTPVEYVDYLKAVLMVNGFSIHEYSPKFHNITFTGQPTPIYNTAPNKNGNPVYTREVDLPERDEFVNYFMKFDNLTAQDAATLIGQPQHQSGKVTPVPSAGGLLITESVPVIRSFIAIKKEVDVPGSLMEMKFVQLNIADAEEVAGIVQQILQQQSQANSKGGATTGGGSRLVTAPNAAQQLTNQLNPGQPNPAGGNHPAGTQTAPDSASVVVQADRRTNRILISGKKTDVAYIEKLIHEFDLPSEMQNFVTYPLRFIRVADFIDLATGALEARGFGASTGGSGGAGGAAGGAARASGNGYPAGQSGGAAGGAGGNSLSGGNSRSSQSSSSSRSSGGSGRSSGGGGSAGGGGGSRGGAGGSTNSTQALPTSVSVGKTLLISDPQSNAIIVSGTPEAKDQIRILIQQMDKRPLQVHIDCILAELALTDSFDFGIDLLRTVETLSIGGASVPAAGILKNVANGTGIIDPSILTSAAAFPAGVSGLNTYFKVDDLVHGYIKASEGTNKLKIIQKPSVSTSNNEPAFISIGERVPYPGTQQSFLNNGGAGGNNGSVNSTVEYQDVVLSLDVTPLINSKEEVTLQIQQINDNVIGETIINNNPVPKIGQQELNTKLTVPNHGIAIIGGLISDNRLTSVSGVPLLARIPIIRNLLGNTTKKDTRRELLIFIQPNIIAGPDDMIQVNSKEIARTAVGPYAQEFARPEVNMSDVTMPTANGNVPYNSAGYPKDQQPGFWRRLGGIFKRKTNVPADTTEPAYPR